MFGSAFAGFVLLLVLAALPSIFFLNLKFLDRFSFGTPAFIVLCAAVVLVTGLFGLTVARFALRLIPIRFGTSVQMRAFVFGLFAVLLLTLFAWVAVFSPVEDDRPNARFDAWFQSAAPEEVRIAGAIAVLVFAICAVFPFLLCHVGSGSFLQRPFVLYLRRFSTFSDRSVMNEVLRACPHGKPIVFLIPTRSAIRDWNPFQIGFAGLRMRNPIKSLPIPVRADDASWQKAARELILAAETIVLDASEGSAAIDIEMRLIESLQMWHKTVLLRTGRDASDQQRLITVMASKPASVIQYQRNWRRAIPRLVLGPVASVFPAMYLGILLLVPVDLLLSALGAFTPAVDLRGLVAEPKAVLVLVGILTAWIYIVLFWRPAINKEAAAALATRLRKLAESGAA